MYIKIQMDECTSIFRMDECTSKSSWMNVRHFIKVQAKICRIMQDFLKISLSCNTFSVSGPLTELFTTFLYQYRSSHRRCFVRKGVLKNLKKFIGKHLCQSLFFNNVPGFRLLFYIKPAGVCFCQYVTLIL